MTLDIDEALFSVKCFVAAMLAYYVALRIGLPRPYWAITTAYIASQQLAGATLSKAIFRLLGTLLGAGAAVVLVPAFVNEPLVLSAALALWLGSCTAIALLDRTPRAYVFLLAGYTASIVGFPSVDTPGAIFDVASLRVQEITIGIVASSLIHGFVFPKTVTAHLLARTDSILADAERWTRAALDHSITAGSLNDGRRIALGLSELDQLAVQLAFDPARIVPRAGTIRALQDRLLEQLPLCATVESRLAELAACGGVPAVIASIATDTGGWLAGPVRHPDRDAQATTLIRRLRTEMAAVISARWRDMLVLNLCSRLADLISIHADARGLSDQLGNPDVRFKSASASARYRSLHRDPALALRAAVGTFLCVMLGCIFWIATAWPEGANAVLISSVCCSLFASVDRPGPVVFRYLVGATIGVIIATIYVFAILPRVTSFEMLAATTAPALLLLGSLLARPKLTFAAFGGMVAFVNSVGFSAAYNSDFATFANSSLALLAGVGFACVSTGLFQTIGARASVARLLRAGWRDVALRAKGRDLDDGRWAGRMLDRVGLLIPRLEALKSVGSESSLDALVDMRTGLVAGRLSKLAAESPNEERAAIAMTLDGIALHFRGLKFGRTTCPAPALLSLIDRCLTIFATDPERRRSQEGLVHLVSLRRNLFPDARGWMEQV